MCLAWCTKLFLTNSFSSSLYTLACIFVHTCAARPRVDLKRRMELILWVPSENLALILWFVEWDPIFLSLANPLTSTRDPSDCRVSGPPGRPPHCREGGRKRKLTDARSVRFSVTLFCWPRATVLLLLSCARDRNERTFRAAPTHSSRSDFGRRPCVHYCTRPQD